MTLRELFRAAGIEPDKIAGDAEISTISADSRQAKPGSLHVCMPSPRGDTHGFGMDALKQGAAATIAFSDEGFELLSGKPCALVRDREDHSYYAVLAALANQFWHEPSLAMHIVGVTGTNGKTTVAWLLRDLLREKGEKAGYLGTLGFQSEAGEEIWANTTPFPVELQTALARARDAGTTALAMEVSSHALEEHRADQVEYDAAIFTNFTQDHLDYHGSMERYKASKWRLFEQLQTQKNKKAVAAFCADDLVGLEFSKRYGGEQITYGFTDGELRGEIRDVSLTHLMVEVKWRGESTVLHAPLGGEFNCSNVLSATAGMLALGHRLHAISRWMLHVRPTPGRFEPVPNERGLDILIDYAHTPDALIKLLDTVRKQAKGRVITVFGCGGDRDRTKRPEMARAASSRSDITVLTSDNPRTEDPELILDEVQAGIVNGADWIRIADRRGAVIEAIARSRPGDAVVIAGKGHENYQIMGTVKHSMDDRDLVRAALAQKVTS